MLPYRLFLYLDCPTPSNHRRVPSISTLAKGHEIRPETPGSTVAMSFPAHEKRCSRELSLARVGYTRIILRHDMGCEQSLERDFHSIYIDPRRVSFGPYVCMSQNAGSSWVPRVLELKHGCERYKFRGAHFWMTMTTHGKQNNKKNISKREARSGKRATYTVEKTKDRRYPKPVGRSCQFHTQFQNCRLHSLLALPQTHSSVS